MPIESEKVLVWSNGTEAVSPAVSGAVIPENVAMMMEEKKASVNELIMEMDGIRQKDNQQTYYDILDCAISRMEVGDFSYCDTIISDDGSLLDHINDPVKKFSCLIQLSKYIGYYGDILLEAYEQLFPIGYSVEDSLGKDFFETMKNKHFTNLSDVLSVLLILENFIVWAEDFYQDEVCAYLNDIKVDMLKPYEKFALMRYVAWEQEYDDTEHGDDYVSYNPWIQVSNDKALYNPENALPQGICDTSDCRDMDHTSPHEPYRSLFSDIHELHDSKNGEDYNFLLQLLHRPEIMARIEYALGIRFADYPFSIQPHFLSFLAYATVDDMGRMRTYLDHAATTGEKFARLRTFLATGEKREFGELILRIDTLLSEYYGEQDGARLGNGLFWKYAEIMGIIEADAEQIHGEYYGADSGARFSKQSYVQELMKRANDVLEDIAHMLESQPPIERIEKAIAEYDAELVQYGSLFRITEKESGLSLDEAMENIGIVHKVVPGNEMTEEQKQKVWNLYEINYADHPSRDIILPLNRSMLDTDYEHPDASFHLFEHKGKCLLTAKFVKQPDGSVYFGAFNTELQFQSYGLGVFVLDKLLSEYDDRIIHGHILKGSEHLLRYYKRYGLELEKDPGGSPVVKNVWWVELYHVVREAQKKEQ